MAKTSKNVVRKRPGRPATGQDPVTAIRLSKEMRRELDDWRRTQDDLPSRSEAIRRLVTIALESKKSAAQMAGEAIDELSDPTATNAEQLTRKRRLTKGPEEFRRQRADEVRRRK